MDGPKKSLATLTTKMNARPSERRIIDIGRVYNRIIQNIKEVAEVYARHTILAGGDESYPTRMEMASNIESVGSDGQWPGEGGRIVFGDGGSIQAPRYYPYTGPTILGEYDIITFSLKAIDAVYDYKEGGRVTFEEAADKALEVLSEELQKDLKNFREGQEEKEEKGDGKAGRRVCRKTSKRGRKKHKRGRKKSKRGRKTSKRGRKKHNCGRKTSKRGRKKHNCGCKKHNCGCRNI
jgi:hypothetical protein